MAGPIGTLASTLLPLFRSVTAWLETAAAPKQQPVTPHDARVAALRERYPDAPQPWIDLLATRLAEEGEFQPEAGVASENEPVARPPAPRSQDEVRPEAAPADGILHRLAERHPTDEARERPSFPGQPAPVPRIAAAFQTVPAPPGAPPAWPQPRPAAARRSGFSVTEADDAAAPSLPPKVARPEPRPAPRLVPRFYQSGEDAVSPRSAAPPVPASAGAPRSAATPAARAMPETDVGHRPGPRPKPTEGAAVTAPPGTFGTGQFAPSPAPAPRSVAPATATRPNRVEPNFPDDRHAAERPGLFPAAPTLDRWADLPAPPAPPPARGFEDAARLRRLAEDQVERAWNG